MAKMSSKGISNITRELQKLKRDTKQMAKEILYVGAGEIADSVRDSLRKSLSGSPYSTGDLESSFGISPMRENSDGSIDVSIGFSGYDRKGVPNQLKARVMESGTSRQPKNPFFKRGTSKGRVKAVKAMQKELNEQIKKAQ